MAKRIHEIRDPIHNFIRLDSGEREVLDSRPFQRLRYIHQLALTYLVYPGATHRRFEHSLGVMELAGRVYDIVTEPDNIHESIRTIVPLHDSYDHQYWRRVLRMAALCHDVGHLPFSHAAEKDLLPDGWDHERLTVEIIQSCEMESIWKGLKIQPDDVAKLAVGPKKYKDATFSDWEIILSEIIVGDAFGVDRMDYLLRDSHHAGVAYGKFDYYRLIDTIRILPIEHEDSTEPALGIEEGGLHSAESMLLARYFMYMQLYFHHVRRIYDIHLKDFLKKWISNGYLPVTLDKHLKLTDNEVTAELQKAARDENHPGHDPARRIINREHFRLLYHRNPDDFHKNPNAAKAIYDAACNKFGAENVRHDPYEQKKSVLDFPILDNDGRIVSSQAKSVTLKNVPIVAVDHVFISPKYRKDAKDWLEQNREIIITRKEVEES
jgi:HD superfamily phosphohydrolase